MSDRIPKIIWQTYKTLDLPIQANDCHVCWKTMNGEYEIKLWDDNDIYNYLKDHFDNDMLTFYNDLHIGVMKADLWRYCILKTHGGIYSDIDSICIKPVSKWIEEQHHTFITNDILIIGLENNCNFCQWTLVATKEHPAMKCVVEHLLENYKKNGIDKKYEHIVHATTGPAIFTDAIRKYIGWNDKSSGEIYDAYVNSEESRRQIQEKGVYLLNKDAFENTYSRNLYGSQNFGDGYIKWIEERKKFL
jgi:alpha 1,6-mannosyltransferase